MNVKKEKETVKSRKHRNTGRVCRKYNFYSLCFCCSDSSVSIIYKYAKQKCCIEKQVVSLQTEIQEQKTLNNEKYEEILNGVDLAQIYKRATRKLNMVRAENNQVYKYKNKKSDMVKQYADIPGTQKNK